MLVAKRLPRPWDGIQFVAVCRAIVSMTLMEIGVAAAPGNDYAAADAVFQKHCLDCHAAQEPEANLVLETFESLMQGGEHGAAIVPGRSGESRLVKMIEGKMNAKN